MRMSVLAAGAVLLASCTTPQMPAMNASGVQQASTTTKREAPVPPALRTPRQQSGNGWPDIGYRPMGY